MIDDIRSPLPHIPVQKHPVDEAPDDQTEAEPEFQPPEAVAEHESDQPADDDVIDIPAADPPTPKKSKLPKWAKKLTDRWHALSKKQKIIASVILAIVVIGAIGGGVLALTGGKPAPKPLAKVQIKPKPKVIVPTTVASTLTGLQVTPDVNQRPVTGVMIENTDAARPQSGLDQAGVVFEAVAEAGITRFLALYQDTQPAYLGPVRSVRPYYLQWCLEFDCAIAHVGGSPDALADVGTWNVKNLDQFANSGAYQRIGSRDAPHNVYTSMAQLNTLETSKGFGAAQFTAWPRKADAPAKTPTAATISLNPSSADFASAETYNPATNNYTRSEAGTPHVEIDASGTQTPLTPKVVIAMVVPESQGALDASGAYYTEYAAVGSGQADIFQDGIVTVGTWAKTSNTAQITFADGSGKPIPLNAGQTWVTILGAATDITYQP